MTPTKGELSRYFDFLDEPFQCGVCSTNPAAALQIWRAADAYNPGLIARIERILRGEVESE